MSSIETDCSREILAKVSPFLTFTHSGFVEVGFAGEGASVFGDGVEGGGVLAVGSCRISPA